MPDPVVSIIILTRNGERDIEQCLAGIFAQENVPPYEVIVIDSASSDQTLNIVRKYPVRLTEIKPSEFGHGRTRNLGASLAKGQYLVYLTQDAVPANNAWLSNLVACLEGDSAVAGAYSRCLPKADCNPVEARVVADEFGSVRQVRSLASMSLDQRLAKHDRTAHFSNVSSCIRRSVLEQMPFNAACIFGEDQEWASAALQAGHTIVYAPESMVYHSHNHSLWQGLRRRFDAGIAYRATRNRGPYLLAGPLWAVWWACATYRFMRTNRWPGSKIRWASYAAVVGLVSHLGFWLGTNHRYLPLWLKRGLSQVPQLMQ